MVELEDTAKLLAKYDAAALGCAVVHRCDELVAQCLMWPFSVKVIGATSHGTVRFLAWEE